MCGIAGIVGLAPEVAAPLVAGMLVRMQHRGPDGQGIWLGAGTPVALGHRRLAILDLSPAGSQPMADVTERFVLTFNGEIYNYLELRAELRKLGARFQSRSDTEVVLEAFKAWGHSCLTRFNGMFAFALLDVERREIFCARDRYGEKPFLFTLNPRCLAFASEYRALLSLPNVPSEHDELRLLQGLYNASTGLDSDPQTVFRSVQQLLPSEAMTVAIDSLEVRRWRYWDVQPRPDYARLSEQDSFALFRDLFVDSVRLRMRSDVPVGSCLSGGLDSGAIVSVVRRDILADGPYHTFTGRFPGTSADEWEFAENVIDASRVLSHVVEPTPEGFVAELSRFVQSNELPVGSSSQYAQYCVFRLASEHGVTVLLDGQGADELLGGYEQYFQFYVQALRERGDAARLELEVPRIRSRYPLALRPPSKAWRDRLPLGFRRWLSLHLDVGSNLLFGFRPEVARLLAAHAERHREPRFHALGSALYHDSFGKYLTTLLRYGDRNSMAHSREVRLPFCDFRLAELALSLPPENLMGDAQTKRLLRESMRELLPEVVRTRWNKQGFRPPQETWFRGELLALASDLLHSRSFVENPFWDVRWWHRVLYRIRRGETQLGWILWQPFIGEAWKKYFLGNLDFAGPAKGVLGV